MSHKLLLCLLSLCFIGLPAWAEVSTEALAKKAQVGAELFEKEVAERDRLLNALIQDSSLDDAARQVKVEELQDAFLKRSREIHLKYREPFVQRVIAETNASLPENSKVKRGAGSDIYLRDETSQSVVKDGKGRKLINAQHRGMQGDLDVSGDSVAVKRLKDNFGKYGVSVSSDDMVAPGAKDFDAVNVTINVEGTSDIPGSSSHETQVAMDALSKETYVSMSMGADQAGRSLVETNDHAKKAAKGLSQPAEALLGSKGQDLLQNMSKGTLKSLGSGNVSDAQLTVILKESGYSGDVASFRKQVEQLKTGHLAQGVGLDAENIEAFQNACRGSVEQAISNASETAAGEMDKLKSAIDTTEANIRSGALQGEELAAAQERAKKMRLQMVDSKVKIEQTTKATGAKIQGKAASDVLSQDSKVIKHATEAVGDTLGEVDGIKKGFKPGMLDIVGYGLSAYNVYDNVSRLQAGEITQNEAVIGITGEVVDTGFGIASDVGMAAAITAAEGTASGGVLAGAASIAAPMAITAASSYAVKEAVTEGLQTYQAFQQEAINQQIAEAKKNETINHFILKAEAKIKEGEARRDWNCFMEAQSIAKRLDRMYQVTGDGDYVNAGVGIMNTLHARMRVLDEQVRQEQEEAKRKMQEDAERERREAIERALQARKARINHFVTALKQEIGRLRASSVYLESEALANQCQQLLPRIETAKAEENYDVANMLIDQYNELNHRIKSLLNQPDFQRLTALLDLWNRLKVLNDLGALENTILNSGYADEFGFSRQ